GLGHDTQVQSLKIDWSSGSSQTFTNVNANQRIVVTEGSSTIGTDPSRGQSVAGEAGNGGREKQEFNAADQKAARAAVLHRADLARSAPGWTGGFVKPDLSS